MTRPLETQIMWVTNRLRGRAGGQKRRAGPGAGAGSDGPGLGDGGWDATRSRSEFRFPNSGLPGAVRRDSDYRCQAADRCRAGIFDGRPIARC